MHNIYKNYGKLDPDNKTKCVITKVPAKTLALEVLKTHKNLEGAAA